MVAVPPINTLPKLKVVGDNVKYGLPVTVNVTGITVVNLAGSLDESVRFRLYVPAFNPDAFKVIIAKTESVASILPLALVIENQGCAVFVSV